MTPRCGNSKQSLALSMLECLQCCLPKQPAEYSALEDEKASVASSDGSTNKVSQQNQKVSQIHNKLATLEESAKQPSPLAASGVGKPSSRQSSKINEIHEQLAAMERNAKLPSPKMPSPGVPKLTVEGGEATPRLSRSPSSTSSPAGKLGEEVAKMAEEEKRLRMEEVKRLRKLKDDEDRRRVIEEEKKRAEEEERQAERKRAQEAQKKAEELKRRESYKTAFAEAQRRKESSPGASTSPDSQPSNRAT